MTSKVTGIVTTKKGRPNWYIVLYYTDADGNIKRPNINTGIPIKGNNKRLANEKLKEVLAEYETQKDLSKDVLFTDFLIDWLETCRITKRIQPTTYDSYRLTLKTHLLPYFTPLKLKLRDIMPQNIQDYVNYKLENPTQGKKNLSVNTVKKHLANISACLDSALQQNIIPFNPATRIQRMNKEKFEDAKFLNEAEIEQVLKFFEGDPLEIVVQLALFYGLRRSELAGLMWSAIDFDGNTISIESTLVKVTALHEKKITKSKSSKDILPLPSMIKNRLHEWKQEQARRKALQPNDYKESDYVFTMYNGRVMHPDFITKHFQRVLARNNFPAMRFHDLRHSSATYLKYLGCDPKDIQTWLRHADIQTTMNLYTHMDMAAKWSIADRLTASMGKMGF